MTITELIEEILNEWAYRVENGMPDPKNPIHLKELSIVLSEMGLSHIKNDLVENLLIEKGKTPDKHVVEADKAFSNPILSKKVSYKDKDGNAKDGIVGNLLRLPKDSPGRVAAEKLLPPEGSPERDDINKDLGGEGQPKEPEDEKGKEGGEEAPKEDPAKAAQAMFDPKADPAMAARLDKEKEVQAQIAKDAEADNDNDWMTGKDGWEIIDDDRAKVEKIRDYSDEEYADETGEYFENDTTQKIAPNAFKDEQDMIEKMKAAKPVFLSSEEMQNMGNTDVGDILSASEDGGKGAMLKLGKERAEEYGKDWDRLEKGIASNSEVPAPIALRDKNGNLHLLAGNTRMMSFTASGKKLPVKVIDYDGEFNTEAQANEDGEFNPIDSKDVAKEMPQADPETFAGGSDIPDGVEPAQLEKFNTDIQKVAKQVADAKAKGEPAPNINLCDVTVPGTNLYCDDNLGIPRDEMPQFKGTAQPGSRAAGMEADASGEVDTEPVFKEMLKEKGIKTLQTQIPADKLKATQKDLVGAKVVGMMSALEKDPNHPKITAPIYVSRDGHVIDGHHRWAAVVAHNAANPDNQIPMKTTVLDMDIKDAIPMANKFAEDMGIAAKKADANKEEEPKGTEKLPEPEEPSEEDGGVVYSVGGGYYSDKPNGPAQYRVVESVVDDVLVEGNETFAYLLFEATVTKKTSKGKVVKLKTIDPKKQKAATQKAKAEKEKAGEVPAPPSPQTAKKAGAVRGSLDDLMNSIPDKGKIADQKNKVNRSKQNILDYLQKESKNKKNPYADELGKVNAIMQKVFKGEKLNAAEKKLAARWIRVAEPTEANPDTSKYYIALEPNNFKKRVKEETGGKGAANVVFSEFRKFMENAGLVQVSATTFGGKKSTANQTFVDEDGKTKILKTKKGENIASVQKDSNGKVNSVTIGGLVIQKQDANEKGISKEEKELRMRNNRNLNEYASKIEAGDMDFIDMDNGVIPDNPKNRVIVIQQAIDGMANRLKSLADKYYIADEQTLALIQKLNDFSKKDPNKNPEEWFAEYQGIFSDIANHEGDPSLKEAWANFAEVYTAIVEMHDGGKGTQNGKCALLPQSTTLETVDVITISDGNNERKVVTLDGRSVKKGVGGASALTSKCNKSTYKNDKDGKKKQAVIEISESHSAIYDLSLEADMKQHQAHHKQYRKDILDKAKNLGVSDTFIKNIENRMTDPKNCPKPLPKGNTCGAAHQSITEAVSTLIQKRKEKGLPVDEATMAKIRMRLENYYYYTFLSHEAYNNNVDVQDFSNDSVLSQKGDTGGAELARKRKISINSSNGVTILAYPKPEFNVGFSLDGRSSNPGAGRFHNEEKRM